MLAMDINTSSSRKTGQEEERIFKHPGESRACWNVERDTEMLASMPSPVGAF